MSASKTNGSTSPAWLIVIRSSWSTRTVKGISLKWHRPPRMAPDSSKGSAPATFTLALSNLPFSPDNPHLLTF
jgi:hypothetical protein